MKPLTTFRTALVLTLAGAAVGWDWTLPNQVPPRGIQVPLQQQAKKVVAAWPEDSRLLALDVLDRLGDPMEVMPHYVAWKGPAPLNMTTVFADRTSSNYPGLLVQTVSYRVSFNQLRKLDAYGRGVLYDVVFNELVAASDSQEMNLLALNLADEVLTGERTPADAQAQYDLVKARTFAGKGSWYTARLHFDPEERKK